MVSRIAEFYSYSSSKIVHEHFFYDLTSYSRLVGLGLMEKEIDYGQEMSKYGNVFRENSHIYSITYSGKVIGEICSKL